MDTCAILSGITSRLGCTPQFTTPEVINELPNNMDDSNSGFRFVNKASIEIMDADEISLREVNGTAKRTGETSLSGTDKSLLALALRLKHMNYKPVLVTDDYALQNLAETLGVGYQPYVERGIRRRYRWRLICPGCSKEYGFSSKSIVCPVCGTKLRKRISSSKKIGEV